MNSWADDCSKGNCTGQCKTTTVHLRTEKFTTQMKKEGIWGTVKQSLLSFTNVEDVCERWCGEWGEHLWKSRTHCRFSYHFVTRLKKSKPLSVPCEMEPGSVLGNWGQVPQHTRGSCHKSLAKPHAEPQLHSTIIQGRSDEFRTCEMTGLCSMKTWNLAQEHASML